MCLGTIKVHLDRAAEAHVYSSKLRCCTSGIIFFAPRKFKRAIF
jgi:hypothetical protein